MVWAAAPWHLREGLPTDAATLQMIALASPVSWWAGWSLVVQCRCGTSMPRVEMLRARSNPALTMVAKRLRCSTCGERPSRAYLCDHPQAEAIGVPGRHERPKIWLIGGKATKDEKKKV